MTWHVVTSDSTSVYTYATEEDAWRFAEWIGFVADYHEAGSKDCETWGCDGASREKARD